MLWKSLCVSCVSLIAFGAALGLASPALAQAAKGAKQAAHSELIKELRSAHKLLAEADRDYDGHRAKAAEEVHKALKDLGYEHKKGAKTAAKKAANAKEPPVHEPQATSDAQLRQALDILKAALPRLEGKHPKAAANVTAAIAEIKTALAIK